MVLLVGRREAAGAVGWNALMAARERLELSIPRRDNKRKMSIANVAARGYNCVQT